MAIAKYFRKYLAMKTICTTKEYGNLLVNLIKIILLSHLQK